MTDSLPVVVKAQPVKLSDAWNEAREVPNEQLREYAWVYPAGTVERERLGWEKREKALVKELEHYKYWNDKMKDCKHDFKEIFWENQKYIYKTMASNVVRCAKCGFESTDYNPLGG